METIVNCYQNQIKDRIREVKEAQELLLKAKEQRQKDVEVVQGKVVELEKINNELKEKIKVQSGQLSILLSEKNREIEYLKEVINRDQ